MRTYSFLKLQKSVWARNHKFAFSMVELLVTLFIVLVLTIIAVPSYTTYYKRTKVSEILNVLQGGVNEVMHYYQANGVLPTKIFNGKLTKGSTGVSNPTFLGLKGIATVLYRDDGTYWSVIVSIDPTVLEIRTSAGILNGEFASIGMAILNTGNSSDGGNPTVNCGYANNASNMVDLEYLPSNCQSSLFTGSSKL